MNAEPAPRWYWLVLLGLTGVALAMRLLWIDRPSFWIDELYSVMHTSRLGEAGNLTKQFGYVPTWITLSLAGVLPESEQATNPETWRALGVTHTLVRLPSAILGVVTVFLFGWLSRGLIGTKAALWFAAFLTISVWHLHMSQTGRFYAQQCLFYNLGLLLYFRATTLGSVWRLVISMVMLFLGFMSQPPALVLGVIIAIDWLIGTRAKQPSRLTVPALIVGAITALACAGVLLIDISARTSEWTQFAGQISQSWDRILLGVVWLVGPVTVLLAIIGWLRLFQRDQRLAVYLGMGAVLPVFAMAAMGATGQFVHVRYTFIALPAWLMLAAVGAVGDGTGSTDPIARLRSMAPGLLAISAGLLQCVGYYTGGGGYRPSWRDAIEYIETNRVEGDLVAGDEHAYWQARYYLGDTSPVRVMGTQLWELLETTDRRVWIIDKGGAGGEMRWPELRERGDLRWYFDRQILQPFSTIKVFLHDPADPPLPVSLDVVPDTSEEPL